MSRDLNLRVFSDLDQLSDAAADMVVNHAATAIQTRGRFTFVLSGGSTPRLLYQKLTEPSRCDQIAWSKVHFFWGDERTVPPDDEQSNFRMANEALLSHLDIPPDHIHRLRGEAADLDAAAEQYQQTIAHVFGVSPDSEPPAFDLVLLGMGGDGHTASLFPHTEALSEKKRWVVPNRVPELDTNRLTMTIPLLNRAKEVVFLVKGKDKSQRFAEVLKGPRHPEKLPSQFIHPVCGTLTWLVDQEAAREVQSK